RDFHVTGVQTCALPISASSRPQARASGSAKWAIRGSTRPTESSGKTDDITRLVCRKGSGTVYCVARCNSSTGARPCAFGAQRRCRDPPPPAGVKPAPQTACDLGAAPGPDLVGPALLGLAPHFLLH